jgi:hypothetical protein
MSYDLFLKSRNGTTEVPLSEVLGALREAGARALRASETRFKLGSAEIDLVLSATNNVAELQVSAPSEVAAPDRLYRLVSSVGARFGWQVYDPQGGVWLEPAEVAVANRGFALEPKLVCWLVMALGIGIAGFALAISRRTGPTNSLLAFMVGGLITFAAGRVALSRIERGRRAG